MRSALARSCTSSRIRSVSGMPTSAISSVSSRSSHVSSSMRLRPAQTARTRRGSCPGARGARGPPRPRARRLGVSTSGASTGGAVTSVGAVFGGAVGVRPGADLAGHLLVRACDRRDRPRPQPDQHDREQEDEDDDDGGVHRAPIPCTGRVVVACPQRTRCGASACLHGRQGDPGGVERGLDPERAARARPATAPAAGCARDPDHDTAPARPTRRRARSARRG